MHHFKKLVVWERSVVVALEVYRLSRTFPKEEKFGITAQMRRCAVSIGSNIAEACGRAHDDGFKHFLHVAYSSCLELETQLIIAHRLGYLENPDFHAIEGQLHEIQKMLYTLIKKTEASKT